MLAGAPIAYWIAFHVLAMALIVGDLVFLNRKPAPGIKGNTGTSARTNLLFVVFLFAAAASFGVWLTHVLGRQTGLEFASGYLIELSLSIDNLFVFLVMFRAFGLGLAEQRRALLVGVIGALVMRGLFIFAGVALLARFTWIQYLFGAAILIAAVRLLRGKKALAKPGRWMDGLLPRGNGSRRRILLSAIIAIEIVDLVFALDSIPAVLAVTNQPFVAYTSNLLAVLGLRSLYFVLANLLDKLRFLHLGLAGILGFVGCKMIFARWIHVPIEMSLAFILVLMSIAAAASLLFPAKATESREQLR